MKTVDAVVIGGGVLGCFAARNLMRWNLSVSLLEEKEDICTGITRANTAIVYAGYDNQPGSLKAFMTVKGNAGMEALCRELEVPFSKKGSLMAAFGPLGDKVLQKKYKQGLKNLVPGLRLLTGREACEMEPFLASDVTSALYAPTTGTINPWQFAIAAYENAVHNGCSPFLRTKVTGIRKTKGGYVVETDKECFDCRVVLNCAGIYADKVQEMVFPPSVRLVLDASDFLVLDRQAPSPSHIIFHESEEAGKGITAVPSVEGNLLLESPKREFKGEYFAVSEESAGLLRSTAARVLKFVDTDQIIRTFAAVRPNPYGVAEKNGEWVLEGRSIGSFVIENPAPGFFSLMGIKTPGLTCADELGRFLAERTAQYLDASPNLNFQPKRKSITAVHNLDFESRSSLVKKNPDYGEIVCQCGDISKGEILEAISRGAASVSGVKRRVGTCMGRCQGSRCSQVIERLLEGAKHEVL